MNIFKKMDPLYLDIALIFLIAFGIIYLLFINSMNISQSNPKQLNTIAYMEAVYETHIQKTQTTKAYNSSKIYKPFRTEVK